MTRYIHLQIVGTLPRQLTSSSALNHSVQCVDHGVHYILAPLVTRLCVSNMGDACHKGLNHLSFLLGTYS